MATMNISLPDTMKHWVETQTDGGLYANSSDYVRDLIRRDQSRAQVVNDVQVALDAGYASGPPAGFDANAFKRSLKD